MSLDQLKPLDGTEPTKQDQGASQSVEYYEALNEEFGGADVSGK